MKYSLLILLVFATISLSAFAARERVALVIGNSDYQVRPLSNPVNDARDIAKVLGELGFDVTLKLNADHEMMELAIEAFGKKLHKNAIGLFYYSGHGAQYAGENYLVPINSIRRTLAAEHLRYKAMPAGYVLGTMQAAENGLNIVILDACRDNPFKGFSRSLRRGLTRMTSAEGSLIAYATAPGAVALDGKLGERNSPYTKHLLQFLKQPNLSIESMLKKVRKAVIQETLREPTVQRPWYEASISDEFYFVADLQITMQPVIPSDIPPSCVFPDAPQAKAPEWICNPSAVADGIKAIGSSKKVNSFLQRQACLASARLSIAQTIQVNVKGMLHKYAESTNSYDNQALEQMSKSVTEQLTQVNLQGTSLKKYATSPNSTLYCLVVMEMDKYHEVMEDVAKVIKPSMGNQQTLWQEFRDQMSAEEMLKTLENK